MIINFRTSIYAKDAPTNPDEVFLYLKVFNDAYPKNTKGHFKNFNLKLHIPKSKWDSSNWIIGTDEETIQKNAAIRKLMTDLDSTYWRIRHKIGREPYATEVVAAYQEGNIVKTRKTLIGDFIDEYVAGNNLTPATAVVYQTTFKAVFKNFLRIKLKLEDVYLDEITTAMFYKLEVYISTTNSKTGRPYTPGTVKEILWKFKALMTYAYKHGEIDKDPGDQYISGVNKRTASDNLDGWKIPAEDLHKIEVTPPSSRWTKGDVEDPTHNQNSYDLHHARLLFLFQTWTGMSYIDLEVYRDVKNIIRNNLSGKKCLIYNRVKTGALACVPLFPETEVLLEALNYNIGPKSSYDTYNRKIKALMRYYTVEAAEDMGTHLGRHLFGSRMLAMGFPMESISLMMGHTSTRQTEKVYARVDIAKVYADYDKLTAKSDIETKIAI